MYAEEDWLPLSGIQHMAFCPRQFALIHVERQWIENPLTFEGRMLHERTDDPFSFEARGTILIARSVPLASPVLGLYGVADVVEFHRCDTGHDHDKMTGVGIALHGRDGLWIPYPVEYKRGKPKPDDCDEVQVCAQAICLEEMLGTSINEGALFYGKTRRRQSVRFDMAMRARVMDLCRSMHELYAAGTTPAATRSRACESCSVADVCLPEAFPRGSARRYLQGILSDREW